MNVVPKFENGEHVKDMASGLEGFVIGTSIYYNGCIRYQVQPKIKRDGEYIEYEWIDEEQIVRTKKKSLITPKEKHGGCRPDPKRR